MKKDLQHAIAQKKQLRVIGFDDAPFSLENDEVVNISGVICSSTRFEGMLWGQITKDGWDVTSVIGEMVSASKYHNQLHLILLDGISFGGFNVVNLPELYEVTKIPCVAMMRRFPRLEKIDDVMQKLPDYELRKKLIEYAGPIYEEKDFVFQTAGASKQTIAKALPGLTDTGKVPEALRLAHLIGAAVMLGESGKRA